MGLDDMAIDEAAAGLDGAAMSTAMGLDGMAFDEAAQDLMVLLWMKPWEST